MLNKVMLIGHVGVDPEVRTLESGVKVARYSLATSKTYKDSKGEKQTQTQWHSISCYNKLAEFVEQYVKKGQRVYVEGEIMYSSTGEGEAKKFFTNVNAYTVNVLDWKNEETSNQQTEQPKEVEDGNDLPF